MHHFWVNTALDLASLSLLAARTSSSPKQVRRLYDDGRYNQHLQQIPPMKLQLFCCVVHILSKITFSVTTYFLSIFLNPPFVFNNELYLKLNFIMMKF